MMETQSFSDDIRRYLGLVWHWWWLLALATVLAAGVSYAVSSQMTEVFQATSKVLIQESASARSTDYASVITSERLAQTYAELMVTSPVLERVVTTLGLELSARQLAGMISVSPVRDTQLINVAVQDVDAVRAALIANALVSEFAKYNQELQSARYLASKQSLETQLAQLDAQIEKTSQDLQALGEGSPSDADRLQTLQAQYRQTYAYLLQSYESVRLAEAQSTSGVLPAENATPPTAPISPRVMQNTLLAAVVGLMLGLGVIFLIEALDDTLRSPEDVSRQLGLPVLGVIARTKVDGDLPVSISAPRSPVSEAFRSLRTNIQFASVDTPIHTLMITSASPGDGKSTVSTNLAAVMAQGENTVAIIDADLRRPRLHKIMRVSNRRGVSDLFIQPQVYLDGSLQATEAPNLVVLTSGSLPPNPSELLASEKMSEVIRQVRQRAEMVILDTPPVLAVTDAVVLSPRVDGVLIVARPGATKLAVLRQTVEQLHRVGAKILGVVLNDVDLKRTRYYYNYKGYYFTYYNHYGENGKPEKNGAKKQKTPEPV
jgi:non-specific protein-tyrosine kinase